VGKRLPHTPRSQIRSALRQLWMRSRERAAALKRAGRRCEQCGSKDHLEVHHLEPPDWNLMLEYIQRHLLQEPDKLEVLCRECHEEEG